MSRSIFGLAAAVLISLPCAARADVYPGTPAPVSPGVTPQRLSPRQIFQWLDTNHDGFLTLREFLAAPWVQNKQQARNFFRWMDTNHDGLVSLREFLAAYTVYSGSNGYSIQVVYPWAWSYWRPWRYGWYWHGGWYRRPGVWPEYAVIPYHAVRHVGPVKHHYAVANVKPPKVNHRSGHTGRYAVTHIRSPKAKHHGGHTGHGQHAHHR